MSLRTSVPVGLQVLLGLDTLCQELAKFLNKGRALIHHAREMVLRNLVDHHEGEGAHRCWLRRADQNAALPEQVAGRR